MWWVIGYFLIGLFSMCAVQYYKGRGTDPRSTDVLRDLNLDMLSWAVLFIWPALLILVIMCAILVCVCVPFWKLAEFCSELGKKHRG